MEQINPCKRTILLALFLTTFFINFKSNAIPKYRIDSIAHNFLEHSGSSCIVFGITENGKTDYYCYGKTSRNGDQLADSNILFEIGSISKVFTATAAAIEVQEGKIKYTDAFPQY